MHNCRRFNITGICVPEMHYMVDISTAVANRIFESQLYDYFLAEETWKNSLQRGIIWMLMV